MFLICIVVNVDLTLKVIASIDDINSSSIDIVWRLLDFCWFLFFLDHLDNRMFFTKMHSSVFKAVIQTTINFWLPLFVLIEQGSQTILTHNQRSLYVFGDFFTVLRKYAILALFYAVYISLRGSCDVWMLKQPTLSDVHSINVTICDVSCSLEVFLGCFNPWLSKKLVCLR